MWPNGLRRLQFGPLREDEPEGSGGSGKEPKELKSDKVKIGDKEYDPKSVESALSLYNALQDEDTGTEIIETLAKRAGLLDRDGKPKVEKKDGESDKKVESRFAKKLLAKLGKDYSKFAEEVGPVFDEAVKEYLDEHTSKAEGGSRQEKWDTAVDSFMEDHETNEEIQDKMRELIEESPFNWGRKGADPKKYLARMYNQAVSELEEESKPKPRRGSRSRKTDDQDELPDIVYRDAPKGVSLDDAIDAALKGIRFRRK